MIYGNCSLAGMYLYSAISIYRRLRGASADEQLFLFL